MADFAQILIKAKDETKGAFDSASKNVRGLEGAAVSVNKVMSALGVGAGLSAAGLAALAIRGINAADAMGDLSARTGVGVKTLAEWKLAAEQSDTSLESLAKGMQRLTMTMGQAEQGGKAQAVALKNLGISSKDPRAAFEQLADAVANSNDPTRTAADLNAVLGRSYTELLPLLQGGAQGLRDSAAASESFADAMARMAPDADRFNDELARLRTHAAGASAEIFSKLVPSLADTSTRVRELLDEGQGIPALVRAFAGLSKLPWDLLLGDITAADTAKARILELRAELGQLERNKASGNGLLMQKIFGTPEEIDRQILVIKNQIAALGELGDKVYKPRPASATGGGVVSDILRLADAGAMGGIDKLALEADELARAMKEAAAESNRLGESAAFEALSLMETENAVNALRLEWIEAGRALEQEVKTPLEQMEDRLAYIDELMRRGVISVDTYGRAYAAALDDGNVKAAKARSMAEELGLTFTSAFEDAVVGGEKFRDVLAAISDDILRMMVRKTATEPLMSAISSFDWSSLFASAKGNVFANAPALSAYSGQVVDRPTIFPFAAGGVPNIGLMGEAGAEAILPLQRGPGGVLGVQAAGNVQVVVNNNANGTQASASERMEGGNRIIEVMIEQVESAMAGNVTRGGGALSGAIERTYGLNRAAGSY